MTTPRRTKITRPTRQPDSSQPGLFDFLEKSAGSVSGFAVGEPQGVHPSIEDFVVKTRRQERQEMESHGADDVIEPMAERRREESLLFISFGSGSSGNSAYLGTRREGIIIDAGIDPDIIERTLKDNGLSIANVRGILLTHDHSDHVRYAYKLVRLRKEVAIFCTPKVLSGLLRRHNISRRIKDYHHPIYKEFPFTLAGMTVTAFDVSHDGTDNCGFFIEAGSHTFAVATDIGSVTERVDFYMRQAQYIMLEANYDAHMLRTGPYTPFLKSRIAAPNGHLDNLDSAAFATALATEGRLRYIFLCHLSAENNTPETATRAVADALEAGGFGPIGDASGSLESAECKIQLMALPRSNPSRLFVFKSRQTETP